MHLSVTKEAFITVIGEDRKVKQIPVAEAAGEQDVVGWFGEINKIIVSQSDVEEDYYMSASPTGEPVVYGETHSILQRPAGEAEWSRRMLVEIKEPVFVKLPQRKITAHSDLFDFFDIDDKGVFLAPEKASHMFDLMRKAAWGGCTVSRRKSELRLDLDRNRPPCFVTKQINGSFDKNLRATLNGLVAGGIITPPVLFNDQYIEAVKSLGVIFEGNSIYHDTPLLPPRKLEKRGHVYHIRPYNDLSPIELTWGHS